MKTLGRGDSGELVDGVSKNKTFLFRRDFNLSRYIFLPFLGWCVPK